MNAFLRGDEGVTERERAWDVRVRRWTEGRRRGDLRAFVGWRALGLPWRGRGLVYDVGGRVWGREVSRLNDFQFAAKGS